MRKEFEAIYQKKIWGDGNAVPFSGSGSSPKNAKPYVDFVRTVISDFNIQSVLDFGHGDWKMWHDYRFENVEYLGIEIASTPHLMAKSKFEAKNRRFVQLDILKEGELPNSDLIISKDCLQHLSNQHVSDLLEMFSSHEILVICNDISTKTGFFNELKMVLCLKSRLKALVSLSNPLFIIRRTNNCNIRDGKFRGLDLEAEPFKSKLIGFRLVKKIDYDGPFRKGWKKRIYLFRKFDASF